jgi:glutamyl-tRNA synthetase
MILETTKVIQGCRDSTGEPKFRTEQRMLQPCPFRLSVKPGVVAQPLRLALTGSTASPGLYDIIEILGPEAVQKRIEAARNYS